MEGMRELLSAAVALINLPYTILLAIALVYWSSVILGALDMDVMNFDVDADVDADFDVDADVHADGGGAVWGLLHFFNVGEIPVAIILSFLFLSMWVGSILANYYMKNESLLMALALFPPNLLAGLVLSKIVAMPYLKLFRTLGGPEGANKVQILGNTCKVVSSSVTKEIGQAEIQTKGAPVLLNVRAAPGQSLGKGEEGVIVEFDKKRNLYIIRPKESEE